MEGAAGYELVVFRLGKGNSTTEAPVLEQVLPGVATSWTPDLDRCFDVGGRYGWSVRAVVEGRKSDWSESLLLEVPAQRRGDFGASPTIVADLAGLDGTERKFQSAPLDTLQDSSADRSP